MRNILRSEYLALLGPAAARFGATEGAIVTADPQWRTPLGDLTVSLTLRPQETEPLALSPSVRIGHARAICDEPGEALVRLQGQMDTLHQAMSCFYSLGPLSVWVRDCPCWRCGASGKVRGEACPDCRGTGLRQGSE